MWLRGERIEGGGGEGFRVAVAGVDDCAERIGRVAAERDDACRVPASIRIECVYLLADGEAWRWRRRHT